MQKVIETIGRIVFYAFIVVVALWTASLTLGEVREILPGDPLTPFFALALFDGGAVAWLLAWMGHARGLYQRGISLIMLVIDLLGVVLLSAGRLFTSGQSIADAPEMIGEIVVWGIIGATLLNLAAVYSFHIADPEVIAAIETGVLVDTLRDEALAQAKANITSEAQQLGAIMAARATGQIKYNLRLPMSEKESAQVIEAQAVNVDQQPTHPQQPGIMARWMAAAAQRVKRVNRPAMIQHMATTTTAPTIDAQQLGADVNPTSAPTP